MPTRKRSILILDGDAFLAGVYARRFESGHWAVRVAETAAEADRLAARKVPDALIVDPDEVDGAETLLRRWRQSPKTAGVTLVVLTRIGDRGSVDRLLAAGADGYLLKGHFVPSEVREKVERLVSEGAT